MTAARCVAVVVDGSAASVALVHAAAQRGTDVCVLIPHTRKEELWPEVARRAVPALGAVWMPTAFGQYECVDVLPLQQQQQAALIEPGQEPAIEAGLVLFTTGTTGTARAVLYEWHAMHLQAKYTVEALGLPCFELVVATHIAHAYAVNALFVALLPQCTKLTVAPSASHVSRILTELKPEQHPLVFLGSPATYAMLLKEPDLCTPLHVKLFYSAGCPLPRETYEQFATRFGHHIIQNYGSSETGNIAFVTCTDVPPLKCVPDAYTIAGSPVVTLSVRLEAPRPGYVLAPGFTGEICVRSPWMSLGYINAGQLERHPLWYRTGDMGAWRTFDDASVRPMLVAGPRLRAPITVVDQQPIGPLTIMLQPWQLEACLCKVAGVTEAAVVALPADRGGGGYGAVVTVQPGTHPASVIQAARQQLSSYACPAVLKVMDAIPRSAAGKVYYPQVEKQLFGRENTR